ncbi:MAG: CoB--CoM heterodisulfide reductase iron-sulfur subunit B family protein [Candidatus Poseidoniaceae archaeon]|nr:CoB--CoM heterodisulfide reductase iron-sulfur subunit B family protein [Candidatus Poseidoniaceae archaeon]
MALKIAYYPGNTARAASSEVEDCLQPLCKTLGIQLIEIPKASSDGGNIIKQSSPKLQHALVARNLALAETKGVDVMTTCATSYGIMCDTVDEFSSDAGFANTINNLIARTTGIEYKGESQPRHLLHLLVEEVGLDKIRDAVINPIRLNVAPYYGPNMQRQGATAGDDPFMPSYLEQLIMALGGTPVDYDSKCQSVGAPALLTITKPVMKMTASVLADAKSSGADMMVSACTISHSNLDSYQSKAGKVSGKDTSMPIVHLAELIAFALGHFPDRFAQLRVRALVIGG